jgi:hypothetical protein
MTASKIMVNRAPVLTLWAAIVADRMSWLRMHSAFTSSSGPKF